jgi:hypothetical protein
MSSVLFFFIGTGTRYPVMNSSVLDLDPLGSAFNWSPGLKRAKMKKKKQLKDK